MLADFVCERAFSLPTLSAFPSTTFQFMKIPNDVSVQDVGNRPLEYARNDEWLGDRSTPRSDVSRVALKIVKASPSDSNDTFRKLLASMEETRFRIEHFKVRDTRHYRNDANLTSCEARDISPPQHLSGNIIRQGRLRAIRCRVSSSEFTV